MVDHIKNPTQNSGLKNGTSTPAGTVPGMENGESTSLQPVAKSLLNPEGIAERMAMYDTPETQELDTWPSFGSAQILYNKDLQSLPFVFASHLQWKWIEERQLVTGNKIQAHEVVRCYVALVLRGEQGHEPIELAEPQLAQFSGTFLLNQLRGYDEKKLIGSLIFTIKRNESMPQYGGFHPFMLKRWQRGVDFAMWPSPEDETQEVTEIPFTDAPSDEIGKEIARLENLRKSGQVKR